MKPLMISVFLLSFLLYIDAVLRCHQCHAKNSETCKEETVECPEGEQCMTISEEYKCGGLYHSVWKGCSHKIPCNVKPYGKVNNETYLMYNIKCCNKDCCNRKFYEMPPEKPPNGVVCPSCFSLGTAEECKAENVTMCRGDEDKCVNYAGTAIKPDNVTVSYGARGCMSSLACQFILRQLVGVEVISFSTFECTSVSPRPPTEKEMEQLALVPI